MNQIVNLLRSEPHRVTSGLALEAAAEIDLLSNENERLRSALQEIAAMDWKGAVELDDAIRVATEALVDE